MFGATGLVVMSEAHDRRIYLDFMRIFSAYGIVMLHVMSNAFARGEHLIGGA